MSHTLRIESIDQLYKIMGTKKPQHPLIYFCHNNQINMSKIKEINEVSAITFDLYLFSYKRNASGSFHYGRKKYDFQEGTMVFLGPNQSVKLNLISNMDAQEENNDMDGWTIFFHPDLIRPFEMFKQMDEYRYFSYEINEALHLSETEKAILLTLVKEIEREIEQNIDQHTNKLITSNLKLILDYCLRFFDRQFYTRKHINKEAITKLKQVISDYYDKQEQLEHGIPSVNYCAEQMNLSPNYLSDLLKKETGNSASTHIHFYLIDSAKTQLLITHKNISNIAYDLGFEYPSHFSKLFKKITNISPAEYRKIH